MPRKRIRPRIQLLKELKPRVSKPHKGSHGILVKGEDDIMVKLARCCNPIPGDPIVGYVTRGHGVSVHRVDCPNVLANKEESDRMIEVSWNIDTDEAYKVELYRPDGCHGQHHDRSQ